MTPMPFKPVALPETPIPPGAVDLDRTPTPAPLALLFMTLTVVSAGEPEKLLPTEASPNAMQNKMTVPDILKLMT